MDSDISGSGFAIYIVEKLIVLSGDTIRSRKLIDRTATDFHGEFNRGVQNIHERQELRDKFFKPVPYTENVVDELKLSINLRI